jgi:aspartate/methionine/tyrosine aminotransferase
MKNYNPNLLSTTQPPIMELASLVKETKLPPNFPLIDVSQAAPSSPPPMEMRQHLSQLILNDTSVHLYGEVLGLPELRLEFSDHLNKFYKSNKLSSANIGITAGCNQAFAAAITSVAQADDQIILPSPWYFNHKMWLDMLGIRTIVLNTGTTLIPDANEASKLITNKTKAIVLVNPNNPTGVEYPPETISQFYDLCVRSNIQLIIDETYKDFNISENPPHDIFLKPNWSKNFMLLYSFSKVFRLTGHRVGAVVTSTKRMQEIEKFLDTSTICANQIGQHAALFGLKKLSYWVQEQRLDLLKRRKSLERGFEDLKSDGWVLRGLGAYFAYLEYPFTISSRELSKRLLEERGVLTVPGALFSNKTEAAANRFLRVAFANISLDDIQILFQRLKSFKL